MHSTGTTPPQRRWPLLLLALTAGGCVGTAAGRALQPHEVRASEVFETDSMRLAAPTSEDWFVKPSIEGGNRHCSINHFASNRRWDLVVSLSKARASTHPFDRDRSIASFEQDLRRDLEARDAAIQHVDGAPQARFGASAWLVTVRAQATCGPPRSGSIAVLVLLRNGRTCLVALEERRPPGRSAELVAGFWADLLDLLALEEPAASPASAAR